MVDSFITIKRFFDNKHYPHGFSRHGDFTIKEAQILERYGYAFNELHSEKRAPITEDERLFLQVCKGLRKPQTEAEIVWLKYIKRIKRPKRFHTLSGGNAQMETTEDFDSYD
ncbi:DUF413 domain-containing protein [Pantoea sp. Mhis]|uniref:DUF413 domain-containing protein n=1 Tax=Pantoea sp. Mhis TaxID=2576759 RepID=UPI001358EC6D|nr:DUF413 domain-containing protein [Pantoea sp. Mhis]MXP56524.1 DUF413 domain-containing protein [Pantoea sp. Mhis]